MAHLIMMILAGTVQDLRQDIPVKHQVLCLHKLQQLFLFLQNRMLGIRFKAVGKSRTFGILSYHIIYPNTDEIPNRLVHTKAVIKVLQSADKILGTDSCTQKLKLAAFRPHPELLIQGCIIR